MTEYIYNQNDLPRGLHYGFRESRATGCGWIAVYNALLYMGYKVNIPALMRKLERQVPLIHGNFGTLAFAPCFFFRSLGFHGEISARVSDFDAMLARSDCALLFYYWKNGKRIGSHFIALHKSPDGITAYNVYANSKGADCLGRSLSDWISANRHFACVLTGIKK